MPKQLIYRSKPLSLVLPEYTPMSFDYEGFKVSDEYVYNSVHKTLSQYRIIVTSKDINSNECLSESAYKGDEVVRRITKLIPFCTRLSLNEPSEVDVTRTLMIKITNVPPRNWESNYQEVKDYLHNQKPDRLRGVITCHGFNHYSEFSKSPLIDLELMLENYMDASEEIRYLVFLYNAIIESEDSNRYMLIGKALEIINVLYPYRRERDRDDSRIKIYFPELQSIFNGVTIRDLISLSNSRREARHFVSPKNGGIHPSLTKKEMKDLFMCSTILIVNVVRSQLGVELMCIESNDGV
ncbi:MAG: hypothetical protein J6Q34_01355 [Bacteroidales bacterium]|nr:hypothetical protein [Bacteroidales bacterium]